MVGSVQVTDRVWVPRGREGLAGWGLLFHGPGPACRERTGVRYWLAAIVALAVAPGSGLVMKGE